MAQNQPPAFIMVAFLLFVAATPLAHGQITQALRSITVSGRLCCTSIGNCPPGATGISGVPVRLNCTTPLAGGTITVGQGITGVNGVYNISIPNIVATLGLIPAVLGGTLPCAVIVNLPLNQTVCPILSTTNGILAGVPSLLNTVLSPVLGLLGKFCVALFVGVGI